jgi:histidinol dehydrogenase
MREWVQVRPIVEEVRTQGDAAVKKYTTKFDRVQLTDVCVPIEVRRSSLEQVGVARGTVCSNAEALLAMV